MKIPNDDEITALLMKYAPNDEEYERIAIHGQIVAEIALFGADNTPEDVNREMLRAACLLHDIGSYIFLNASPEYRPSYPQHALFGAMLLEEEGIDPAIYEIVRTHVLLGITPAEITQEGWVMPQKNFEPTSVEGRLLCYGDRFHSKGKHPGFNRYETFLAHLKENLSLQAEKFETWATEFGIPDIDNMAKKYGHSIR